MKTLIVLLTALFSIPSVSLAGTSGAGLSSLEEIYPRREKTYSIWKHKTKRRNRSEAKQRRRSSGGKILSFLSLALGITGTVLILISFPIFSGLLLFITGAFLTLNAVWLAIMSLINLDQQHDKPFWWISFAAMCLALLPTLFAMTIPLLVILVLTALGWTPDRFF